MNRPLPMRCVLPTVAMLAHLLLLGCSGGGGAGAPVAELPAGWAPVDASPAATVEVLETDGSVLWAAAGKRVDRYDVASNAWTRLPDLPDAEVAALHRVENRLIAGTYQQGVFELGAGDAQWSDRSAGLSGTGARTVVDFAVRNGELFAATQGSGVFRRPLDGTAGQWSPYRDGIPAAVSYNVSSLATHRQRLVAGAGANGYVYLQVEGENGWREVRYAEFAGSQLSLLALLDTPTSLIGGGTAGFYRSVDAGESWATFDPQIGLIGVVRFATHEGQTFALAAKPSGARIYRSGDDGINWRLVETLAGVQAFDVAIVGETVFLANLDGLWKTPVARLRDA